MVKRIIWWIQKNKVLLINAGSLIGSTGVTSLLGFVYWWFAARRNSPEVVGFASAAISAMTLLGTFSMLGLGTLLIGELPRQHGKEAPLISAALILVGGIGGCVGIAYALTAPYLSTDFRVLGTNIENTALFATGVSLTAITLVLDQALIGLLRGELQLWRNTLFAVVKLAALFAVDFWLSHVTGMTIYATLIVGNIVSLIALALFIFIKRAGPPGNYLPRWKLLRQLGPAALKHHALNISLHAPALILPVLITILLSPTVNAWFYVAWNLSSIANTISVALASTLYAVSSAKPSVLASKLRLTLSLAFIGCLLINFTLILAPKLALGLFGHNYAEQAAWSLRVLALESFPFIIKNHFIALSRIRKQVGRTILITITTGSLELGGSIMGAHLAGLNGLSLGWLCAMCIEALFMAPVIYVAARAPRRSQYAVSEQSALETQATWPLDLVNLPVEQTSFGTQAAWLLDTLALTAIRPGIAEADTLHLQRIEISTWHLKALQFQKNEKQSGSPGNHKLRLKPTRLERITPYEQHTIAEDQAEEDYVEYNL